MAKPKAVRATTNPLGQKINQIMESQGHAGDYAWLAAHFGIAVPSTYSWIDKGTVSKEHYPKLVEWSGKSLDWWFDVPPLYNRTGTSAPYGLHPDITPALAMSTPANWPLSVPPDQLERLSQADKLRAEGFILGLLAVTKSRS